MRHRHQSRPDDCLSGDARVLWRRNHADRVAGRLHQVPRPAAGDRHCDHLSDSEPVIDLGPDPRRVFDRYVFLALAVFGQHRARSLGRHGRVGNNRHRQARPFAAARFRRDGHAANGDLSRLPPICASRRPPLGLARRRYDPRRGGCLDRGRGLVFLAGADLPPTDRRSSRLPQPQFCFWLVFHLRRRHRHVRHDLPGAAVSGSGARLQRAADRLDDHRYRPGHYDDVAAQYSASLAGSICA